MANSFADQMKASQSHGWHVYVLSEDTAAADDLAPMALYLAGPMRGIPESNYPAFRDAAAKLRAAGHTVFSPVDWDEKTHGAEGCNAATFNLNEALCADLTWICLHADAVVVLPGWEKSSGANAEAMTAYALGKPVYRYTPADRA